ncbi:hypothetical protein ABZX75_26350 [Streptomyces sp. NPDC003038]|uniref:hypothetical protein n=1 Tax=unclassified Streptomyces TaxID=2593676 RepID=UPI0033B70EF6
MIERRPLGTGPRPATPPPQPSAAHRARLAAEGPATTPSAEELTGRPPGAASGRRTLGSGNPAED